MSAASGSADTGPVAAPVAGGDRAGDDASAIFNVCQLCLCVRISRRGHEDEKTFEATRQRFV